MDFPYLYYALLAALLFPAIIVFLRRLARRRDASSQLQLPTVGIDFTQAFPWTRARLRSVLQSSANMYEGYSRFCKTHDMPFVTPSFGNGPVVVLPPSYFDVLN